MFDASGLFEIAGVLVRFNHIVITWLPLLALSIAEKHAWGDSVKVPLLFNADVHARFLLALPLLIVAELVVHRRMRLVVGTSVKRGLVPDDARERFDAAIAARGKA